MKKFYFLQKFYYLLETNKYNLINISLCNQSVEFNNLLLEYYIKLNDLTFEISDYCKLYNYHLNAFKSYKKTIIKLNNKLSLSINKSELKQVSTLINIFTSSLVTLKTLTEGREDTYDIKSFIDKIEHLYQNILKALSEKLS